MRQARILTDPFTRVILGLALGIFCGLFFGENAAPVKTVGLVYVRLLQMTVLPYVLAAVVAGIGRLEPASAGALGLRAVALIIILWIVSWLTSFMIPLAYPVWDTGSFFSTTDRPEARLDLLTIFVPSNIFEALTNTIVPAVVVFSLSLGLALMAMREKQVLLRALEVLEKALGRIMAFVVKLAPIGIFALAAAAAGTMPFDEFSRLKIYLITYAAAWAVLAFVTLPLLVAIATPFAYRDVLRHARDAMVTAFAVNTVLVVLPIIAEECKRLIRKAELESPEADSAIDVLAPTAFTVPTAGTPISLAFILFAAWFIGKPIALEQYPTFAALGLPSSFGGMWLALPFLLDFFELPADLFQLFIVGAVVTSNLWTSLAAMHGVAICLLAASAVRGRLRWLRLTIGVAAFVLLAAVVFSLLGIAFKDTGPEEDIGERRLLAMRLLETPVEVSTPTDPEPLSLSERDRERLGVIRARGTLRVGIQEGRLPYMYRNDREELVGLDIELMHALARDLGVGLEFVPVHWQDAVAWLDSGRIDLYAGGVTITPERALSATFTRPYVDETLGFLIRDEDRRAFADMTTIRGLPSLRIGVAPHFFNRQIERALPNAELIVIDTPQPFLRGELPKIDALLLGAEMGAAWTLIYPRFTAIAPRGLDVRVPVGFVAPTGQADYLNFLNKWLEVNVKIGLVDALHRHWVLGKPITEPSPRWSIIRDVLHWVD